ncbi:MAG: toll/interleukin-1 receptor domain-containing protein [Chloroflexota bacterium]
MSHVFISYSKKNKAYARKLADHLLANDFDVWIDDRIDFGANWEREIFKAIDDCAAIIVIMIPDSYESIWVQRERQHAENRNKQPFPLLLDGEVFPFYNVIQYYDVPGDKLPVEAFLERLATFVPRSETKGMDVATTPQEKAKLRHEVATNSLVAMIDLPFYGLQIKHFLTEIGFDDSSEFPSFMDMLRSCITQVFDGEGRDKFLRLVEEFETHFKHYFGNYIPEERIGTREAAIALDYIGSVERRILNLEYSLQGVSLAAYTFGKLIGRMEKIETSGKLVKLQEDTVRLLTVSIENLMPDKQIPADINEKIQEWVTINGDANLSNENWDKNIASNIYSTVRKIIIHNNILNRGPTN